MLWHCKSFACIYEVFGPVVDTRCSSHQRCQETGNCQAVSTSMGVRQGVSIRLDGLTPIPLRKTPHFMRVETPMFLLSFRGLPCATLRVQCCSYPDVLLRDAQLFLVVTEKRKWQRPKTGITCLGPKTGTY